MGTKTTTEFWWVQDGDRITIAEINGDYFETPGCEVPGKVADLELLAKIEVPDAIVALIESMDVGR